jgi:hypothetical protein
MIWAVLRAPKRANAVKMLAVSYPKADLVIYIINYY